MLAGLFNFRVNFAIVFLGAFLIILLIKITALFPSQYYFSFSKLVDNDRGPFIVDPPSVTGAKLCELLRANRISTEQLGVVDVDCRLVREDTAQRNATPALDASALDRVYGVSLQQDGEVRAALHQSLAAFVLRPMTDEEINTTIADSKTASEAANNIFKAYQLQLHKSFREPLGLIYKLLLRDVRANTARDSGEAQRPQLPALSPAETAAIHAAHQDFLASFPQTMHGLALNPIQKSAVDEILNKPDAVWDLPGSMAGFYYTQIEGDVQAKLRQAFAQHHVGLLDQEHARAVVFKGMASAGLPGYLIGVGIRLMPVLLFGLVLGAILGRPEFTSISLAAALSALLLSWPLILMWDQLVSGRWHDQRPLFMAFYGVYILSFFLTARMGAVFGAWVRQRFVPFGGEAAAGGTGLLGMVTSREVLINIFAGLAANGLVYAWNVMIPSFLS